MRFTTARMRSTTSWKEIYDGAILDIMMPKMDGITVLKKVRAAGKPLPVIMLTAKSEIDGRVEGLEMFLMNPKFSLSADQFFEKIWGLDSEAEINVVWVYISNLRKKLASVGSVVSIKSTRINKIQLH